MYDIIKAALHSCSLHDSESAVAEIVTRAVLAHPDLLLQVLAETGVLTKEWQAIGQEGLWQALEALRHHIALPDDLCPLIQQRFVSAWSDVLDTHPDTKVHDGD